MNRAKLNRINNPKPTVRAADTFSEIDRAQFFTELMCWAEMKGFKSGFAAVQFKERFGAWPPWGFKDLPAAQNVGAETMAYIDERKKLWTKERKKQRKAEEQKRTDAGLMPETRLPETPNDWIELGEYGI